MGRALTLAVAVISHLALPLFPSAWAITAAHPAPRVSFTVPASSVAFSNPVLDGRHVIYGIAAPRFHRPVCVSCGQTPPFTNFRIHIYLRSYQRHSAAITLSQPRPLFVGPRGAQIALLSLARSWLVYETEALADQWHLFARNVVTGRVVLLDSPSAEGTPSRFLHGDSDGRTAVWQSWTRMHGQVISVIRSYTLATGRRQTLLSGGTGRDYFYGYPEVSGSRVILVREPGNGRTPQILSDGLTTHHRSFLTPPSQPNDEPAISGNIAAWVHGRLTVGHTHGLVLANLVTGRRVALRHSSAQLPRVVAGRYVIFAADYARADVQVYDARTGRRWTVAAGKSYGSEPGPILEASGDMVLFQMIKPCIENRCQRTFTLTSIG